MAENHSFQARFGKYLREARNQLGLTQAELAERVQAPRLRIVKLEAGAVSPDLEESLALASAVRLPLQFFLTGQLSPPDDPAGIALELYHLGIRDIQIANARPAAAFRTNEQVLPLALAGDRPDPRIVEAISFVLTRNTFDVALLAAFARSYDRRIRTRLAWLADIAQVIGQTTKHSLTASVRLQLERLVKLGTKSATADSLGHPTSEPRPPAWKRWNINYAGTLDSFIARTSELAVACEAAT